MLPIIQRRRIEAEILREVYETVKARHGDTEAKQVIADAVRKSAIAQGKSFADMEKDGPSLQGFIDLQKHWTAEGALEIDVTRKDDTHFEFNVTRCRYAEMYKEMGLGEIGHLLSCNRDGTFCQGYDPSIEFRRTQTIMQGASHCDFKYRATKAGPSTDEG